MRKSIIIMAVCLVFLMTACSFGKTNNSDWQSGTVSEAVSPNATSEIVSDESITPSVFPEESLVVTVTPTPIPTPNQTNTLPVIDPIQDEESVYYGENELEEF